MYMPENIDRLIREFEPEEEGDETAE